MTVYAYRPAGSPCFELGYVVCGQRADEAPDAAMSDHVLPTYFTLGVRELLVDGHVGLCSDPASEDCWPVLLNPTVRAVSSKDTKSSRIVPETSEEITETQSHTRTAWSAADAMTDRAVVENPTGGDDTGSDADSSVDDDNCDTAVDAAATNVDGDGIAATVSADAQPSTSTVPTDAYPSASHVDGRNPSNAAVDDSPNNCPHDSSSESATTGSATADGTDLQPDSPRGDR